MKKNSITSITTLSLTTTMVEPETYDIQPGPSKSKDHGTNTIHIWDHDTPFFNFKVNLIELKTCMMLIGVGEGMVHGS